MPKFLCQADPTIQLVWTAPPALYNGNFATVLAGFSCCRLHHYFPPNILLTTIISSRVLCLWSLYTVVKGKLFSYSISNLSADENV